LEKKTQNTNWEKEALNFLLDLYPIKDEKDIGKLVTDCLKLMQRYTGAQSALLVRLEDAVTARIIYSSDETVSGFVNELMVTKLLKQNAITISKKEEEAIANGKTEIAFPVSRTVFEGLFLLCFDTSIELSEGFRIFLEHVRTGLKDIVLLVQTSFFYEQVTTRFNAIMNTIDASIVFVDDSGRDGWMNQPAARLLQLPEGINKSVAIAGAMQNLRQSAINNEEITAKGAQLFMQPNQTVRDWKWIYGDPPSMVLNVSCAPMVSENIKGRLWVFTDITAMHLATEKLQELNAELAEKRALADEQNRAKSDFLANMSHEIRTPMNGVIGMTSLLSNTNLTEEQRDYVDTIRTSGESLLSIINDILDFSKIESGKMELEEAPFRISSAIEDTYDLLSTKAIEKGLDLLYFIEPNVPTEVIGDLARFRQVLINLVSNGLKFTDKGEILVSVETKETKDDIYTLQITVKDTGIGIPEDKYHRLFESFSQVDSSTTRKYGGTGLGLAICQRLVSLMHGSIWVESEYGKGSSFIFTIQVRVNNKAIRYQAKNSQTTGRLQGRSALILDDNATNLKILSRQCALWGMEAHTAGNYKQAFDLLQNHRFDIAVIDLLMPEKNGIEVATEIKQIKPRLPLILFSSAGYLPVKEAEVKSLFAAVLNKPTRHNQIEETLVNVLNKSGKEEKKSETSTVEIKPRLPINILVAEDDEINQKLIKRTLEKMEYTCDIVATGRQALDMIKQKKYHLVFMDVMMPEMDGYEATRHIHEMYSEAQRPVIIALTANALTGDKEKLLAAGMNDYISKPYKMQDIKEVITKWNDKLLKKT